MQAMIFAAGLGTRLKPLTDDRPKALVTLNGVPLIDYVIDRLRTAGVRHIVVNVHHFADMLCEHLSQKAYNDLTISVSDERRLLLDTGGGVRQALQYVDTSQPLLIHNVDIVSNSSLTDFIKKAQQLHCQSGCEAALMVRRRTSSRYLLFDEQMQMRGWTNTKTGEVRPQTLCKTLSEQPFSQYAFSGIHLLFPEIYPLLQSYPERFGITDFYVQTCQQHRYVGIDMPNDTIIDVGKPETLAEAERQLQKLSY